MRSRPGRAILAPAVRVETHGARHLGAIRLLVATVMVPGSAIGPEVSGMLNDCGVVSRHLSPGIVA